LKDESTIDPFATDLFLTGAAVARSRANGARRSFGAEWNSSLPKITEQQLLSSSSIPWLPALSIESLSQALARYTHSSSDLVSITQTAFRELATNVISTGSHEVPSAYACLAVGPDSAPIVVEVDAQFAARIVDRTLGGDGSPLDVLRGLSRTEQAVMEFLCLVLCRELNSELGGPLIRLAGISAKPPEWLAGDGHQNGARHLIAAFTVDVNNNCGSVRMHFSANALSEVGKALSGEASNRTKARAASLLSRKIRRYAAVAPDVPLSAVVGNTEVAAGDLASLECGDVVIVQQVSGQWIEGRLEGPLPLRVGDGDRAVITSRVIADDRRISGARKANVKREKNVVMPITVTIESVLAGNAAIVEERSMTEENSLADSGEGAALLDGLLLTVRVELAGRRMRMEELAQLRAGQILELGCRATDPVDLVVDGRSIARGELVDIEGRLGVRIAQVPA